MGAPMSSRAARSRLKDSSPSSSSELLVDKGGGGSTSSASQSSSVHSERLLDCRALMLARSCSFSLDSLQSMRILLDTCNLGTYHKPAADQPRSETWIRMRPNVSAQVRRQEMLCAGEQQGKSPKVQARAVQPSKDVDSRDAQTVARRPSAALTTSQSDAHSEHSMSKNSQATLKVLSSWSGA